MGTEAVERYSPIPCGRESGHSPDDRPSLDDLLAEPEAHLSRVDRALDDLYGTPQLSPDGQPLDGLIETVLSQHTSDVNSERAFARLRSQFASWDEVRHAPPEAIAEAIRCGGLARVKTVRILEILDSLADRYGSLNLDVLRDLPLQEARDILTSLHGVGPKTASCVLLFSLGRPAFPVDTHVLRLSRRIGLVSPAAGQVAIQALVESRLQPERIYPLHVNLIRHGRLVCKALSPLCDRCGIRPLCRYGTAAAYAGHKSSGA